MTATEKVAMPLFPLTQTLFPGMVMNLQIFEQRYLALVRESTRNATPFGVVPILRGSEAGAPAEFHPWGTVAFIEDWNSLPNGLLGIQVRGERRCRVLDSQVNSEGLILAEVQVFAADPQLPLTSEHQPLLRLWDDLALELGKLGWGPIPDRPTDVASLGWRLAQFLPLSAEDKQLLLACDSLEERLTAITQVLGRGRPAG